MKEMLAYFLPLGFNFFCIKNVDVSAKSQGWKTKSEYKVAATIKQLLFRIFSQAFDSVNSQTCQKAVLAHSLIVNLIASLKMNKNQ